MPPVFLCRLFHVTHTHISWACIFFWRVQWICFRWPLGSCVKMLGTWGTFPPGQLKQLINGPRSPTAPASRGVPDRDWSGWMGRTSSGEVAQIRWGAFHCGRLVGRWWPKPQDLLLCHGWDLSGVAVLEEMPGSWQPPISESSCWMLGMGIFMKYPVHGCKIPTRWPPLHQL